MPTPIQRVLHIYGQDSPHDACFLLGTREALLALREALDQVLAQEGPKAARVDTFTADGEGYATIVAEATEPQLWGVYLPYTNDIFASNPQSGLQGPWKRPDILTLIKQKPA